ncbi:MAG: hypothetical protein AAGF24_10990 [Cyanobacteria bacterium P01_H01_bin.121]
MISLCCLGLQVPAAQAGNAHFQTIVLPTASNRPIKVNGQLGGSFSLHSIANTDRSNNACLGFSYADVPDYILSVEQQLNSLTVRVESRDTQQDTTLLIDGPTGLYCADDTDAFNQDARVSMTNIQRGEYRVWVGYMPAPTPPRSTRYFLWLEP